MIFYTSHPAARSRTETTVIDALQEVIEILTVLSRPYYENGMSPAVAVAYGAQDYRRRIAPYAVKDDDVLLRLQIVNVIAPKVPVA